MVLVATACANGTARAQDSVAVDVDDESEEDAAPRLGPRPLGITISGGSSLGSYQAGYLYYLIESLRSASSRVRPRTFNGASAGSINALIAMIEHCSEAVTDPTESLFYRTWMPMGFGALYDRGQVTATSVFNRTTAATGARRIRARFEEGLREDCDVLLGTSVTRVHPEMVSMAHQQLSLPRMTERFLLRVVGRGYGRPPLVENHRPEALRALEMPMLALDGEDADSFTAIEEAVYASSGFPLAFEPIRVAHCSSSHEPEGRCTPSDAHRAEFVDGGIFTSIPLELTALTLRDPTSADPTNLADRAILFTLSPTPRAYPVLEQPPSENQVPRDLIPFVLTVLEGLVETTLSLALSDFIATHPEVSERMVVSRADHPPISDLLAGFAGIFEEDFRRYDFYLGMTHAHRMLVDMRERPSMREDLRELVPLEELATPRSAGWRPYFCLRAVLQGEGDRDRLCSGNHLASIRALAAVSLERVYDACQEERVGRDRSRRTLAAAHRDCRRAVRGAAPPALFGRAVGEWERTDDNELLWVLRRLAHHGFAFDDLGVHAPNGDAAYHAIRDHIGSVARRIADLQGGLSPLLRAGVQSVLDTIAYRPEAHIVYLDLGGSLMVGWSATTSLAPWFRGVTALEVRGISTLISSDPNWFGLTPLLGIELEPTPLSSGILQARLGLRVGYLFSSGDSFLSNECGAPADTARPCSRPVIQAAITLTLVHLVRISVTGEWSPPVRPNETHLFGLRPHAGLQLIFD